MLRDLDPYPLRNSVPETYFPPPRINKKKVLFQGLKWAGCLASPNACALIKTGERLFYTYDLGRIIYQSFRTRRLSEKMKRRITNYTYDTVVSKNERHIHRIAYDATEAVKNSGALSSLSKEIKIDEDTISSAFELSARSVLKFGVRKAISYSIGKTFEVVSW